MLATHILNGRSIVYIDETTFNVHMRHKRTWQYSELPVKFLMARKRLSGVTLYGAIGNCLTRPQFMTAASTSIDNTEQFLHRLTLSIKTQEGAGKPLLVIDNHSAHRSLKIRGLLAENFDVLWLPTQSSPFNSIESLWAFLKNKFRSQVATQTENLSTQEKLTNFITELVQSVPDSCCQKFLSANRAYLLS
jgi:transposase